MGDSPIWEEALPLGNGRIGAMVFSGIDMEKLSLNDDTLWSGYPQEHNIIGANKHFKEAQKLAMDGKYKEAQEIIEKHMLSKNSQRYLPLGDLLLDMNKNKENGEVTNYRRALDLQTALSTLSYVQNGVTFYRESFVSAPDQALIMRIWADTPKAISFTARLACQLPHMINVKENCIVLDGKAEPSEPCISFATLAHVEAIGDNCNIEQNDDFLQIKNADEVIIRLCCRTSFTGAFTPSIHPYLENCNKDLEKVLKLDYETLKSRHISDYQELYNRVDISFGEGKEYLPIPERLENWETSENDPSLFALLFQYGRYLMIAGSRLGTNPLNLQGIWNPHLHPPWNGNYTLNINTEMNYWPAEVTNLAECHMPLIEFTNNLRISGAKTAHEYYNARGFVVHHNSDIWAMSTPVGAEDGKGCARWGFWPMAGGWLSTHAFAIYEYSQDKDYLQNIAWPIIRDAARFFLDVLVEDNDGSFIFAPSTSPENDFIYEGKAQSVSKTATMTTAIIKETLENAINCCHILNIDEDFKKEAIAALRRLPIYKIGSRGELLEWSEELQEHEPTHRHTSHLYFLYPRNKLSNSLQEACKQTLNLRGDEGTGWTLAWRICLWARLQDSERAFSFLKKQLRPCEGRQGGCYPNLFGSHPPFQIDSNFGACAGIAEMLLQNNPDLAPYANYIWLLPALPKALSTGYVKGLRAKGGITVDIYFEKGLLIKAELLLDKHLPACKVRVRYINDEKIIKLLPNQKFVYDSATDY